MNKLLITRPNVIGSSIFLTASEVTKSKIGCISIKPTIKFELNKNPY